MPRQVTSCRDTSVRRYFYGRPSASPYIDPANSFIEGYSEPVLAKVINDPSTVSAQDRFVLSYFIANLYIRNPIIIESMKKSFIKAGDDIKEKTSVIMKNLKDHIQEPVQIIDQTGPSIPIEQFYQDIAMLKDKNGDLMCAKDMFASTHAISECIRNMTFHLLIPPENHYFITTDKPVSLVDGSTGSPVGAGWGVSTAMAYVALSPRLLMLMAYFPHKGTYLSKVKSEDVQQQNKFTLMFASREVYSLKKDVEAYKWMRTAHL